MQTGFGTSGQSATFVSIVNGKFAIRVPQGTEGAVKRYSEKAQKEFWELIYPSATGLITALKIDEVEKMGKQLKISMDLGDQKIIISVPVESRYFNYFCTRFPNVDTDKNVKLVPFSFEDSGKTVQGINMFQETFTSTEDLKIAPFYTKETPHDQPQAEGTEVDADDWKIFFLRLQKWQCRKIEEWNNELQIKIGNKLGNKIGSSTHKQEIIDKANNQQLSEDDLPF